MGSRINMQYLDVFHSYLVKDAVFTDKYGFPLMEPTYFILDKVLPFDKANTTNMYDQWLHFYIDDYRFERIWNNPNKYLPIIKKFKGVITPDFSVCYNMPIAMQIWNTYRNRALAFWLQKNNVDVIINVRWGDERSYDFCFEGINKGCNIAISSNGTLRNKENREIFKSGLGVMIETLKPNKIINYSYAPRDIWLNYENYINELIVIENYNVTIGKKKVI